MKIKRVRLQFENVISMEVVCEENEWFNHAEEFKHAIIKNNLYATGPVFYQISRDFDMNKYVYTLYVPINDVVKINKKDTQFKFIKDFRVEDCLMIRHSDLDEPIKETYNLLEQCAYKLDLVLEKPYYNIYLDVYGEGIIDVFAPIKSGGF